MQGRISRRAAAFSIAGMVLAAAPSWAADDVWSYAGQPSGGTVTHVVMDPASSNVLYAIAKGELYKSTDGGASWDVILSVPDPENRAAVADVELAPTSPGTVYASVGTQGVYKSTDSGATWTQQRNGLPPENRNNGTGNVTQLVADPVNDGVVYAMTYMDGVYKTVDGGATWTAANTGIGALLGHDPVYDRIFLKLAVDPMDPDVLYLAAAEDSGVLSGIYKSADAGAHWAPTGTIPQASVVAVDPTDGQHLYAGGGGFYESTDGGANWNPVSSPVEYSTFVRFDSTDHQHIWTGGEGAGFYESHDGGATWDDTSATGHFSGVYDMAVDPNDPTNLFVATYGFGIGHSTDGGATWGDSSHGIDAIWVEQMLTVDNGDMYIGTQESGAFISHDGGVNWDNISEGMGYGGVDNGPVQVNLMLKAKAAGTLYAATSSGPFKTVDGGAHWTLLFTDSIGFPGSVAMAMSSQDDDIVYMSDIHDGLFKTVDGGATWHPLTTGLPALDTQTEVQSLAVDPDDDKVAYAGTLAYNTAASGQPGLFKTVDGGATWTHLDGLPAGDVLAIAIDPEDPQTLYVSGTAFSMYKSTDGGQTWAPASDGLDGAWFSTVYVDPNDSDFVYATGMMLPVYVSMDGGEHWMTVDQLQPDTAKATTQSIQPGHEGRKPASTSGQPTITAISVDPRHVAQLYGAGDDGKVYGLLINTDAVVTSGGQQSGGSSSGNSSGGGGFPLLAGLALLGIGLLRRRH